MEYEIGDDPQGLPDPPEGTRDGGLKEPMFFRKEKRGNLARKRRPEEILDQMGEPV